MEKCIHFSINIKLICFFCSIILSTILSKKSYITENTFTHLKALICIYDTRKCRCNAAISLSKIWTICTIEPNIYMQHHCITKLYSMKCIISSTFILAQSSIICSVYAISITSMAPHFVFYRVKKEKYIAMSKLQHELELLNYQTT